MKNLFAFFLIIFLAFSTQKIHADSDIILFYSDACPYCHDVVEIIETYELEEEIGIQMLEASSDNFQEIYHEHLEKCNVPINQGGYPTLYHNGECSFGRTNNIEVLAELTDLSDIVSEEAAAEEESEEENNEEIASENENPTNETPTIVQAEPLPFWIIVSMFIGPAIFIYIAYLIIKKLNL